MTIADVNRDTIPDELVLMFSQQSCHSSFISHLFTQELKHLFSEALVPRGVNYRITPASYLELPGSEEPISTFAQTAQSSLSNLVRTIRPAIPHFIQCISPGESGRWDDKLVRSQLRTLQLTEIAAIWEGGPLIRRSREQWERKYRMLGDYKKIMTNIKHANEDVIIGDQEVYYSQRVKQILGDLRKQKMEDSAVVIQRSWRQYNIRKIILINTISNQVCSIFGKS